MIKRKCSGKAVYRERRGRMKIQISTESAALKKEPGGGEWVDEALYGMEGELLEVREGWGRVRMFYGYEGWIPKESWTAAGCAGQRRMTGALFTDVKSSPQVQAETLLCLPRGALLDTGGERDGWRRVFLNDAGEGFVPEASLLPCRKEKRVFADQREEGRLRRCLTETALGYRNVPYRWGGKTPRGIDCSGLVQMAYLLNGIVIYRDAKIMPGYPVRRIPPERKKPGDLLYFPGHVAMYLGAGRYLHATAARKDFCVTINSLDPSDQGCRKDLAEKLLMAGSIF